MSALRESVPLLLGFLDLEPTQLLIMGVVAVLLFGKRLPEVARSFGKSVMELKKGLQGIEQELGSAMSVTRESIRYEDDVEDHVAASAPKFEPPAAEPAEPSAPLKPPG